MTRILVLGATGDTGRHFVRQAVDAGHHVLAVSRHPERLELTGSRLETAKIDVTSDSEALERALAGRDAVVSCLGRGLRLTSDHLIARSAPKIVAAMEKGGPRRLLFLSAFGVGATISQAPARLRFMFRTLLGGIYADKAAGEEEIRRSTLDWTFLLPVRLTNKPATGGYAIVERLAPKDAIAEMPRADLATAMLAAMEDPASVRKSLIVTSRGDTGGTAGRA